jgi:8-oxo-dGTP pyrophosphatase MutT (NUDIX family)
MQKESSPSAAPKTRICVRALLFDPAGRLLLFRYRNDPNIYNIGHAPAQADYWGTVGGGVEGDEDLQTAIRREIEEETGHGNIVLGPAVWQRRTDLMFYGTPLHIDETYFVAHTADTQLSTAGHTQIERKFVAEMKWWDVAALEQSADLVYPLGMQPLVRALAGGIYPEKPVLFTH